MLDIRNLKKKIIRDLIYYFALIFIFFMKFINYDFLVKIGGFLGYLFFAISKKDKSLILENLKTAFPDKNKNELLTLKNHIGKNLGKSLFEFLAFNNLSYEKFSQLFEVNDSDLKRLDDALKQNRGVLLLTAHFGNWELFGAYLASRGYPINVIAKKIYDSRLNDILVNIRAKKGVKTLLRSESTRDMIKMLKNNETLAILIDQDTKVDGCFVDFFDKKAYTPTGAAVLARKYNSIVLPLFIRRTKNNRHILEIDEAIELTISENYEDDIIKNTQKFTEKIEEKIKQFPEQWIWIHKRWNTKQNF